MLARRIPSILPPMSFEESIQTTKIYSVTGLLRNGLSLIKRRPFRISAPTISDVGLIGGGTVPRPGEVSLAHNGVLFLDELPEFAKNVLEVMRQPVEDKEVTITRSQMSLTFPGQLHARGRDEPLPVRVLGRSHACLHLQPDRRPAVQVQDIRPAHGPDRHPRGGSAHALPGAFVGQGRRGIRSNRREGQGREGAASRRGLKRAGDLLQRPDVVADAPEALPDRRGGKVLLENVIDRLGMSARAHDRILKVARTIADLEGGGELRIEHLSEAIQYRSLDRNANM